MKNILLLLLIPFAVSFNEPKSINETIYQQIKDSGLEHPEIVYAQAILETGWFKSYNCKQRNNIFGLYDSKNNQYYSFESKRECIIKYKEWIQDKYYDGQDYYDFLNCMWEYKGECKRYAAAEDYTDKLKVIVKQIP